MFSVFNTEHWHLHTSNNVSTSSPYEPAPDALVRELKVLDPSCDGIIRSIRRSIHGFPVCGAVWLPSAQGNLSVRRSCGWSYKPWTGCVWRNVTLVWCCGVTWLCRKSRLSSVVTTLIWKQCTALCQCLSPQHSTFQCALAIMCHWHQMLWPNS